MIADAIVAIPGDTPLPNLLAAIHQHRLGHVARVLSSSRASLVEQLSRAGVPMEEAPDLDGADRVILVFSAALSARASELLLDRGAERCWMVSRSGRWREMPVPSPSAHLHLPTAATESSSASG